MNKLISAALLAAILSLSACGGGGSSGSDTQAGVSSGGTGSFSNGPVTSFGSIVVNGIHFDQTSATVRDTDGQTVSSASIKLGMVVELTGSTVEHVGSRDQAQARDISLVPALVGPIDRVGTDTLVVMGQTVLVSGATHVDESLPQGLASLSANEFVTVYGFHDARRDVYVATRIERRAGAVPDHYVVHGVIQDLDPINGRCRIGQQTISYQWGTDVIGLANGRVASAKVSTVLYSPASADGSSPAVWQGQVMTLDQPSVSDRDQASVDGVVTSLSLDTAGVIAVNGLAVDTRQMVCSVCGGLSVGDRVQVEGRLVNNVIVANKVSAAAAN
ncbi:MAG: hypothetical protein EPO09_20080 [Aquabacterium sp.]|uniref:DUF5666 domain-containing protein n=1 Tax=Aquabacterium sp. TaxID=1872578 RepID=UPI00120F1EC4|nr:DUF5666 domain-containing protein [Aquabacterium sp.]TAK85762.1 MAG: hypothetical protein EPO09_20080 [Aquabacterium sp.]